MGESFLFLCPRSVTEFYGGIVSFPLYQARKYVLTSWYCNSVILSEGCKPEFWIGRSGGAAKNVRHSVRPSVRGL